MIQTLALHERELPWNPTNLQTPRLPFFPGKLPWAPWGKNRPCARGSCERPVKILKLTVIVGTESSLQELHKLTTASVKFLPELKLVLRLHISSRCDLCSTFCTSWRKGPSSNGHRAHQKPHNRDGFAACWGSISFGDDFASFQSKFSSWLSLLGLILACRDYMKLPLLRSIPFQNSNLPAS